jgi:hypothetical protein
MPDNSSGRLTAKANELYWQTSRPAGHLAEELGVSRSKFYALIEPLRIALDCDACGAPLAFSSRSDREAGRGRCPECGATADVPVDDISAAQPVIAAPEAGQDVGDSRPRGWVELPGNRELWLTAIAGAAVGILATALLKRR